MTYAIVILVTFIAVFINTVTGFGFGIISVVLFSFIMPTIHAIALSSMMTVVICFTLTACRIKYVEWRILIVPTALSVVAGYFCICFGANLSDEIARKILGVFLILLSLFFLFYIDRIKVQANAVNGILMGLLSGTFTGLFGIGGPPMVLYFIVCFEEKRKYMATLQAHFSIVSVCLLFVRFLYGQITVESLEFFSISLLPMIGAVYLGTKLFELLGEKALKKTVYIFMAICGSYFLIAG